MMLQKPAFTHLSTSIPTLDSLLSFNSNSGIIDLQSVPGSNAMYCVVCSLIVSHLNHDTLNKVIVIDTLQSFPWRLLEQTVGFDSWDNITSYRIKTFAHLFQFFTTIGDYDRGSVLIIINDIHDLIDSYKLELRSVQKESLLKFHIYRNSLALKNKERFQEDPSFKLPELPPKSDLLTENPITKADIHVNKLLDLISKFTINNELVCLLVGRLDSKFKYYSQAKIDSSSQISPPSSANNSFFDSSVSTNRGGRMAFVPSLVNQYQINNGSYWKNANFSVDSLITSRIVFYKDWNPTKSLKELSMIFVAEVDNLRLISINKPVYFDYCKNTPSKLIDLSSPEKTNIQIRNTNVLMTGLDKIVGNSGIHSNAAIADRMSNSDTHIRNSNAQIVDLDKAVRNTNTQIRNIPSSPNMTPSQARRLPQATSTQLHPDNLSLHAISDLQWVVEDSEDELNGSILSLPE